MLFISNSVQDTFDIAAKLANGFVGGEIVLLEGELGAGKTTFAKGIAKALGIKEEITSPTFVLLKEYQGRLKLYHFDLYRIEDAQELEELGFEDYLYQENSVSLIEWNKFKKLPLPPIYVKIDRVDDNIRRIEIT
ncbi:MAG: tRNA (adenosine(37)-N6)-threonylcarbamoyltransferase complex ATPase subunit type 1 TsaE [Christensenellales bacterium]|jgi:tRNA threonylcarbamoyladenosine biosynthesis protein TsaE